MVTIKYSLTSPGGRGANSYNAEDVVNDLVTMMFLALTQGGKIMRYPVLDAKATGARIKELRKTHNLKVGDVAKYMGFESEQAIYKWQRGESLPTVDNLYALSVLFETSIDDILRGDKEVDASPLLPFYSYSTLIFFINSSVVSSNSSSSFSINPTIS